MAEASDLGSSESVVRVVTSVGVCHLIAPLLMRISRRSRPSRPRFGASPHSSPGACLPKRSSTRSLTKSVCSWASKLRVFCATKPTRLPRSWRFQRNGSSCRGTNCPRRGTASSAWFCAPGGPHASTITRRPPAGSTYAGCAKPDFAALVASALANVQAWSELEASRVRIISAADEARRQVTRDLHDGAQQRIVVLALKARMLAQSQAAQTAGLDAELRSLEVDLNGVLEELHTIASGLHPAALSRGGLAPALGTLARRSPVPVMLDARLPGGVAESVEVAAYYFVAETLTNTTKHAEASRIDVTVELRDGRLWICVRDDGVGGADPAYGSGLVGLKDRIEAFGGTMTLDSPSGAGTTLVAQLPLPEQPALEAEPANA
jgi:signal transduction histidine kinase